MLAKFINRYEKRRKDGYQEESVNITTLDRSLVAVNDRPMMRLDKIKSNPFDMYSTFVDALEFLEPSPVSPPDYSTLAQSRARFPCFDHNSQGHEALPSYEPTIYKLDKFSRKLEWVSPYDPAPTRHWKDVLVELNSTQLNIYYLESNRKTFVERLPTLLDQEVATLRKTNVVYDSLLTTNRDVSNAIQYRKFQIIKKTNLLKSYSLQHAKIGLAADYKKHRYTLRLRCETEQFLIQFPDAESMIEWNMALCLGRDNALDLSKRSMPHYRTVPRRHRHHQHRYNNTRGDSSLRKRRRNNSEPDIVQRSRNNSVSNFFHRRRAISNPAAPAVESEQSLKNKFHSILRHGQSGTSTSKHVYASRASFHRSNTHVQLTQLLGDVDSLESGSPAEISEVSTSNNLIVEPSPPPAEHEISDAGQTDFYNQEEEEEEEEEEEDFDDEYEPRISVDGEDEEDDEDEGEEEYEDDSIEEEEVESAIAAIPHLPSSYNSSTSTSCRTTSFDLKWYPEFDRLPSRKKITKDAIRCMSTLSSTDRWCGRSIVKAFDSDKFLNWNSPSSAADPRLRKRGTRFVKEYVVTSSGLIPL